MLKQTTIDTLLRQKLLPLYYHESAETSAAILKALYDAGIRIIEYTNRGKNALENFRQLKKAAADLPGLLIGIGTIKNKEQAEDFIRTGADFIIAPSVNVEVGKAAEAAGLLWIPGCMTPTEIASAENAGAQLVKIFPGNLLGPDYLRSIRDLFPGMKFMPTGGVEVNKENLSEWFGAGVCAVGMGSKLISREALEANDFEGIRSATLNCLKIIGEIKP